MSNKVLSNNRLANSPHYPRILEEYNIWFSRGGGKVNNAKFYREVVAPLVPGYKQISFYQFLKRFKSRNGLEVAVVGNHDLREVKKASILDAEASVTKELMTTQEATDKGLALMLNIGTERLQEIRENPHLLSAKEAAKLLTLGMKAQDSRINALSKLSEEGRKVNEAKQKALKNAAYDEGII